VEKNNPPDNDSTPKKKAVSGQSSSQQISKQDNKSGRGKKKPKRKKKQSLKASWREASPVRKLEIIFLGLAAAAAFSYVGVAIWQNIQTKWLADRAHKPLIVHPRPPGFQYVACTPTQQVNFGNIVTYYKNIGDETAPGVNPPFGMVHVIPEKPPERYMRGRVTLHDSDCAGKGFFKPAPLEPGIEKSLEMRQSAETIPMDVKYGDAIQVEFPVCTYYTDKLGTHHGTCDLYRLGVFTKDLPLIDKENGAASIPCDGIQYTGKFMAIDHCQQ
jgi:hypothetical protein